MVSRWFLRFFSRFLCRRLSFLRGSNLFLRFFGDFFTFIPYFLVTFLVHFYLSMSTSFDTSASKFSPVTQNMAVSRKQKQIQVMHTADVLYFNVIAIHINCLKVTRTHVDKFLPFLDLALGLWTGGWVGWKGLALHTGERSSMLALD